jgi:hypothetical protein
MPSRAGTGANQLAAREPRHRGAVALFAGLLTMSLALPLIGIALLTVWDSQNSLSASRPVWVAVKPADAEVRNPVDVVLGWQPVPPLLSPGWVGTVTAVDAIRPEGVMTGDSVARVDGIQRLAAHTASPFYRSLALGDRGEDVANLNDLLGRFELKSASGDVFTRNTLEGVRQFAARIGSRSPSQTLSFDPSWIVYLPIEGIKGRQFDLPVGAPAPVAGTEIIAPSLQLVSGTVTTMDTVVHEAKSDPVDVDVRVPITTPVPDTARFVLSDTSRVQYAGQELVADIASNLMPEALNVLSGTVPLGARSVRAAVSSPATPGAVLIPSAAIYATTAGSLCVIRRGDVTDKAPAVSVISNSGGSSVVTGELAAGDEILVGATAERRKCA